MLVGNTATGDTFLLVVRVGEGDELLEDLCHQTHDIFIFADEPLFDSFPLALIQVMVQFESRSLALGHQVQHAAQSGQGGRLVSFELLQDLAYFFVVCRLLGRIRIRSLTSLGVLSLGD